MLLLQKPSDIAVIYHVIVNGMHAGAGALP